MKTLFSSPEPLEARIAPAVFVVTNLTDSNVSGSHSLRDAINQANLTDAPDTITFAPSLHGTILLSGANELPIIIHPLTIKGPGANKVIIDSNHTNRIFGIDDHSASTDSPVSISGLAMINGRTITSGGAIFSAESLTLKNCVISGNTAADGGGGVTVYATDLATQTVSVSNCLVSGNSATSHGYGGGLSLHAGKSIVISGCTVLGNTSTYEGGGAFVQIGSSGTGITISHSRFTGNTAVNDGGGMFVTDFNNVDPNTTSKVTISTTIVSGNSVTDDPGLGAGHFYSLGGGIYLQDGNFTLSGVTVRANTAVSGAGGIEASLASSLTITGGSITGNLVSGGGAGTSGGGGLRIAGNFHPLTISGAHVTDNHSSASGGGIYLTNAGVVKLTGDFIDGNTANGGGGGLEDAGSTSTSIFGGEFADNAGHSLGGAMDIAEGLSLDIHSTKITGNFSLSGGGAYLNATSSITVIGAIITGNQAQDSHGGGLRLAGGANVVLTMKGGTISGNHADTDGGGIFMDNLSGTITGTKITGNAANRIGGGIDQSFGTVTLGPGEAALITGNVAVTGPDRNGI